MASSASRNGCMRRESGAASGSSYASYSQDEGFVFAWALRGVPVWLPLRLHAGTIQAL